MIFRLSTNFINHDNETCHFVKHIFLVLISKVNVRREISFCSTLNKGQLGIAHPVRWGWEFCSTLIALNLFPLVKASKKYIHILLYTCKIKSWTRIGWPMGIWLLIVSNSIINQKPFLSRYWSIKKGIIKRFLREDKKNGPRRNSRLPKKYLFHSRPEVLRTTFRRYKISKSQILETLVLL